MTDPILFEPHIIGNSMKFINVDTRAEYSAVLSTDTIIPNDKKMFSILSIEDIIERLSHYYGDGEHVESRYDVLIASESKLQLTHTIDIEIGHIKRNFEMKIHLERMQKSETVVLHEMVQELKKEIKRLDGENTELHSELYAIRNSGTRLLSNLFTNERLELWARTHWWRYQADLKSADGNSRTKTRSCG